MITRIALHTWAFLIVSALAHAEDGHGGHGHPAPGYSWPGNNSHRQQEVIESLIRSRRQAYVEPQEVIHNHQHQAQQVGRQFLLSNFAPAP